MTRSQGTRRLRLEGLERRDCPAVMFGFEEGVLTVTGDDAANDIEVFQPRDLVVEIRADGELRTFTGVDEIRIATNGGDDTVRSRKPKEIVVVGSKIKIDAGPDNDLVEISDGGGRVSGRITGIAADPIDASIDLGTGADRFTMQIERHDRVDLDLTSGDGGDRILVGMLLPAVQQVRAAAARIQVQLGGGDNAVVVNARRVDDVRLDLAAAGGGNSVQVNTERDGFVDPYMDEDHPPYCTVALDFGGGGNLVDVGSQDFHRATLDLTANGGGNAVKHEVGHALGFRHEHVRPEGAAHTALDLRGEGNAVDVLYNDLDNVDFSVAEPPPERLTPSHVIPTYVHVIHRSSVGREDGFLQMVELSTASQPGGLAAPRAIEDSPNTISLTSTAGSIGSPSAVNAALQLGSADDAVTIATRGVDNVDLAVDTGEGDDTVNLTSRAGQGILKSMDGGATWNIALGPGDDRLELDATGFGHADLLFAGGDGNDQAGTRLYVGNLSFDPPDTQLNAELLLGAGDDQLTFETGDYAQVISLIDAGEGDDEVRTRHRMFAVLDRSQLNVTVLLGGGSDTLALESVRYREIHFQINTGPRGEGADVITIAAQISPALGPVRKIDAALDGHLDEWSLSAKGYGEVFLLPGNNETGDLNLFGRQGQGIHQLN